MVRTPLSMSSAKAGSRWGARTRRSFTKARPVAFGDRLVFRERLGSGAFIRADFTAMHWIIPGNEQPCSE